MLYLPYFFIQDPFPQWVGQPSFASFPAEPHQGLLSFIGKSYSESFGTDVSTFYQTLSSSSSYLACITSVFIQNSFNLAIKPLDVYSQREFYSRGFLFNKKPP
jgi:hypothetical protein